MKHYKKTFLGSVFAMILGTSCCWLSSLAIWFGGVTLIGLVVEFIENIQLQLILLSGFLGILSLFLFVRNKKKKSNQDKSSISVS